MVPPMHLVSNRVRLPCLFFSLLLVLAFIPVPVSPVAAGTLPEAAPLVVAASETWQGATLEIGSDVLVLPGATLTVRDAHLTFRGGALTVAAGGRLEVFNSTLATAAGAPARALSIQGVLVAEDSTFSRLGGITLAYPAAHGAFTRVRYVDNEGAVNVSRRALFEAVASHFEGNRANAIWTADATTHVRATRFLANQGVAAVAYVSTTAGSFAFGEAEGTFTDNVVAGSGRGLHFQGADAARVHLARNLIANNTVGVNLQSGSSPTLRDNHFAGNRWAVVNFGPSDLPGSTDAADARGNYWGSPEGAPAPGSRNGPSGPSPVLVSPWLTEDPVPDLTHQFLV